jgi:FkbM family methyltransferase
MTEPLELLPPRWPAGYFPLYARCVSKDSKKRGGGLAVISPSDGVLDYFTHQSPLPGGYVGIDVKTALIRVLAQPGEYVIRFADQRGAEHEITVLVIDPMTALEESTFRDGKPLWSRSGADHDRFIIREQPYRKLPVHAGVVLDLGAHIGTFTRDALDWGATRVIAYEPEPVNFAILQKNTAGLPVELHEAAVGGEAVDRVPLYLSWSSGGLGSGGNSKAMKITARHPVIGVSQYSIAGLLTTFRPVAVKLDVKRAEEEVNWAAVDWPDELRGFAIEADVKYSRMVLDPVLKRAGFTAIVLPPLTGWKRAVAIWGR